MTKVTLTLLLLLLLAATLAFAQECIITRNTGPRGENPGCDNAAKPYCVKSLLGGEGDEAFCSECSPYLTAEESFCDCAPGKICDRNGTSKLYGACQTMASQWCKVWLVERLRGDL